MTGADEARAPAPTPHSPEAAGLFISDGFVVPGTGLEPIPLLGYLYHDYAIAYAGWISHGVNVSDESLRIQLARSVVYGMLPGVYDKHFAPDVNRYANARKLLKNCTELISGAGQPFLVLGRMLRPPPLACTARPTSDA